MNKAKIMLSAVAAIAAVGGAFALKSKKVATLPLYSRQSAASLVCDKYVGFGHITVPQANTSYNYISVNYAVGQCARQYYTLAEGTGL